MFQLQHNHIAAKCLLTNGAEVKAVDENGRSSCPLGNAAGSGKQHMVDLLVDVEHACGRKVDSQDGAPRTALYQAAQNGHIQTVESLKATRTADFGIRDLEAYRAAQVAMNNGHSDVLELTIQGTELADEWRDNLRSYLSKSIQRGGVATGALLLDNCSSDGHNPWHGLFESLLKYLESTQKRLDKLKYCKMIWSFAEVPWSG